MLRSRLSLATLPVALALAACAVPPPPSTAVVVQAPPHPRRPSSRRVRHRRRKPNWCPRRRRVRGRWSGSPAIGSSPV